MFLLVSTLIAVVTKLKYHQSAQHRRYVASDIAHKSVGSLYLIILVVLVDLIVGQPPGLGFHA